MAVVLLFTLDPPGGDEPPNTSPTKDSIDFDPGHPFLEVSFPVNRGGTF